MLRLVTVQTSVALAPSLIIEGPGMYTNRCARAHTYTRARDHTHTLTYASIFTFVCAMYSALCTM